MAAAARSWARSEELLRKAFGTEWEEQLFEPVPCEKLLEAGNRQPRLPTGLGAAADALLDGGLLPGEVLEIFGAPGSGKTQLALSLTASFLGSGGHVLYVTTKDAADCLALRLRALLVARKLPSESVAAALKRVQLVQVGDFTEFAHLVTELTNQQEVRQQQLLVLDGLSLLLVPFVASQSFSHRWRLVWAQRALRQMAARSQICVVMLTHTIGGAAGQSGGQMALGQLWSTAATARFQLQNLGAVVPEDPAQVEEHYVQLCLEPRQKGLGDGCGHCAYLRLDDLGVTADLLGRDQAASVSRGGG